MDRPVQQPPAAGPETTGTDGTPPPPLPPPGYPYPYVPAPMPVRKDQSLGIVSLLLAVAAWVTQTHVIASIPAIVIGIVALVRIRREPEKYDADTGRITAILGIVFGVADLLLIVVGVFVGIFFVALDIAMQGL